MDDFTNPVVGVPLDAFPDIDLRAVQLFLHIAGGDTFREAGERLGLQPPHVTKLVRGLEEVLEVQLLVRNSRNSYLTPSGRSLIAPAQDLLAAAEDIARAVSGRQSGA